MSPCGVVNCKAFGPLGSLLTNRMTQLVTYGSVGGVGRKPGPYPALDSAMSCSLHSDIMGAAPVSPDVVGRSSTT